VVHDQANGHRNVLLVKNRDSLGVAILVDSEIGGLEPRNEMTSTISDGDRQNNETNLPGDDEVFRALLRR
jgi:hypothetical protein